MNKFAVLGAILLSVAAAVFAHAASAAGGGWQDLPTPRDKGSVCDSGIATGCPGRPSPGSFIGGNPDVGGGGGGTVFCFFDGRCYIMRAPKI